MIRKLFRNAAVWTPSASDSPLAGSRQGSVERWERGALLCEDGLVAAVGEEKAVLAGLSPREVDLEVDCGGRCLVPGFVDPHTHLCFTKPREEEFRLRLAGTDYLEILRRGGGILSSVRSVREASEDALYRATREHALSALRLGTTTLEIKSGYGLTTEAELKMLRVIARVGRETPVDVVATFLGAHAVPGEYAGRPDAYVDLLVGEMLPAVAAQEIARFCDVFCDLGAFGLAQSRRILAAARKLGLGLKIHADEMASLGGAGLAAELGALSAEHLLAAGDGDLRAMARAGTIAVLLPATAYSLRKPYAPARKMVELGIPVALATDGNPGTAFTESMPFVFGLAVLNMGLAVEEALVAATLNAAFAVGRGDEAGSLQAGKAADFLLLEGESPAVLAFRAGLAPVTEVYKKGERVSGAQCP